MNRRNFLSVLGLGGVATLFGFMAKQEQPKKDRKVILAYYREGVKKVRQMDAHCSLRVIDDLMVAVANGQPHNLTVEQLLKERGRLLKIIDNA
ncbi:MAG TPA: hypothetical protein VG944_08415 [Fimbriimonas sp.]|nr:hypothetical protein [Fimbriimonas sp.]